MIITKNGLRAIELDDVQVMAHVHGGLIMAGKMADAWVTVTLSLAEAMQIALAYQDLNPPSSADLNPPGAKPS